MLKSNGVKSSRGKKRSGNVIDFTLWTIVVLEGCEKDWMSDMLASCEDAANMMDRCHCNSSKPSCLILSLYYVVAAWGEANCAPFHPQVISRILSFFNQRMHSFSFSEPSHFLIFFNACTVPVAFMWGFVLYSKTCACQAPCSFWIFTVPLSSLFFPSIHSLKLSDFSPKTSVSRLPFVSLINVKPAPTWPTISLKNQNNWWLFHWTWPLWILGEARRKSKNIWSIHPSALKSMGFVSQPHPHCPFSTTGILPTIWVSCRRVKAETGRGAESHWCNKHCHLLNFKW